MLITKSGKHQRAEGTQLLNQEKIWMLREKENYKYLGILAVDTIKQAETKEKKKKERKSIKMNEKTFRNQPLQQKSCQRNKHQGSPSWTILRIILEMDKGRTSTNRQENKKTDDDKLGFTSERWYRQTICVKRRRRKSIEDSKGALIWGLESFIKKSKERLITVVNNNADNMNVCLFGFYDISTRLVI